MKMNKKTNKKSNKNKQKNRQIAYLGLGLGIVSLITLSVVWVVLLNNENQKTVKDNANIPVSGNQLSENLNSDDALLIDYQSSETGFVSVDSTLIGNLQQEENAWQENIEENIEENEIIQGEIADSVENDQVLDDMNINENHDASGEWFAESAAGEVILESNIDMQNLDEYFVINPISDAIFERINGISYCENPDISLGELRYVKVLHYNFEHKIQVGELIVNQKIAEDIREIFKELFLNEYEIQSMYLIDRYYAGNYDDTDRASIEVNNTSAFYYRTIAGTTRLSNHALGMAIDINPQQNPYVSYKTGSPVWEHENANDYIDRTTGKEHMITESDLCYQLFISHGFT